MYRTSPGNAELKLVPSSAINLQHVRDAGTRTNCSQHSRIVVKIQLSRTFQNNLARFIRPPGHLMYVSISCAIYSLCNPDLNTSTFNAATDDRGGIWNSTRTVEIVWGSNCTLNKLCEREGNFNVIFLRKGSFPHKLRNGFWICLKDTSRSHGRDQYETVLPKEKTYHPHSLSWKRQSKLSLGRPTYPDGFRQKQNTICPYPTVR